MVVKAECRHAEIGGKALVMRFVRCEIGVVFKAVVGVCVGGGGFAGRTVHRVHLGGRSRRRLVGRGLALRGVHDFAPLGSWLAGGAFLAVSFLFPAVQCRTAFHFHAVVHTRRPSRATAMLFLGREGRQSVQETPCEPRLGTAWRPSLVARHNGHALRGKPSGTLH